MAKKISYEELEQRIKELEKENVKCKQVEDELRKSKNQYKSLFDNSAAAMFRTSIEDGKVLDVNDAGVKMFIEHPVFGSGVGNYRYNYMQYLRPDHVTGWGFHPYTSTQNTYLTFVTEMGAVGLSVFLLMLFFAHDRRALVIPIFPAPLALKVASDPDLLDSGQSAPDVLGGVNRIVEFQLVAVSSLTIVKHNRKV